MNANLIMETNRCSIAPGSRLSLLRVPLLGWPRDTLGLYMDAVRRYGDTVRFRTSPWSSYLVIHPNYVKHVLQDNHKNYSKRDIFNQLMTPVVDSSSYFAGPSLREFRLKEDE